MKLGAVIERGLTDWQIIQQKNGLGRVSVEGRWYSEEGDVVGVYVRVVKEDSGDIVIPWKKAEDKSDHEWEISLDVPAGGLYRLETCLKRPQAAMEWSTRGDMVHFFGVGDLYVIAGQSNSAGYGKDPIYDSPELGVHLFANNNAWRLAAHPLNDSTDTVHEVNRENANSGNSPYLTFGKYLKRELHYPIGLIQTSLGGSPLSRWNPEETGDLYENMLDVIRAAGGSVRGILWYQGCSDVGEKERDSYYARFESMVSHMRAALDDETLPILTVQLDRCVIESYTLDNEGWSKIREAQRRAAREMKNVFVVPALDFTLSDCIHVSASSNVVLGERLAKLALNKLYGRTVFAEAPDIVRAVKSGDREIQIDFAPVYDHLYCFEVVARRMALKVEDDAGEVGLEDYSFPESGGSVCVKLVRPLEGQAYVHHAIGSNPIGWWLIDFATHLPVLSFYCVPVETRA